MISKMANNKQLPIKSLIHYWEETLAEYKPMMAITSTVFIEQTISRLKELVVIKPDVEE